MTTTQKILLSIATLFLGTIGFDIVKNAFGQGQYVVTGLMVFAFIYIWFIRKDKTEPE